MESTDLAVLFLIMAGVAALPSTSTMVVATRSAAYGFKQGGFATAGIATGDLLFVILALSGLTALAGAFGEYFSYLKYAAALYLVWFGARLVWTEDATPREEAAATSSIGSYLAGLLLTLGDLKAVFFYASLFPTFVDISNLSLWQGSAIAMATVAVVASVKLVYASAAHRIGFSRQGAHRTTARKISGAIAVGAGVLVATKA